MASSMPAVCARDGSPQARADPGTIEEHAPGIVPRVRAVRHHRPKGTSMQVREPTTPMTTAPRPQLPAQATGSPPQGVLEDRRRNAGVTTDPGTVEYASWMQLLRQGRDQQALQP
jgi:hypothetical protein